MIYLDLAQYVVCMMSAEHSVTKYQLFMHKITLFEFPSYNSKEPSKYMTILIQIEMMLYVSYISIEGL